MICSFCGVSEKKARLLDAISAEGVVKICEACFRGKEMPLLRKPTDFQLVEAEKRQSFYQRASAEIQKRSAAPSRELKKTETTLREIIDKKYGEKTRPSVAELKKTHLGVAELKEKKEKSYPNLVDNFHWSIMRARRARKITQEQLAKEISESEAAIKMAEQGILPDNYHQLIKKLGDFLGIKLFKQDVAKVFEETRAEKTPFDKTPARILKFDSATAKNITISDLKKMKKGEKSFDFQPAFDDIEELPEEEDINKEEIQSEEGNEENTDELATEEDINKEEDEELEF